MSIPPSSPRLPSPPPPTEIQIGPKSPMGGPPTTESPAERSIIEANASRRIHPGTKAADMAAGPPLIPLSELDSAFQLQEHLKALHYHYTKPPQSEHTVPITRETASIIASQPEGLDGSLWLYELCRFLINKCNDLIIGFLFDNPPCSATTCPEMRASEWQFLCAVHETPKSCCAIDYCCHTLDWATNIVTSQKIFPSRLSLGAGDTLDDRGASVKHLVNIFRRLHRIFAHAWFQHRGVFWQVEGQTGLYVLFKTVCDTYELLPAENYKLPPEAEGLDPHEDEKVSAQPTLSVLKPDTDLGSSRTNTRRHIRQSPSVGSAVTTVLEADEEDQDVKQKMRDMQITEEEGEAEVPVIVETYEGDKSDASAGNEVEEKPEQNGVEANIKPIELTATPGAGNISDKELEESSENAKEEAKPESAGEKENSEVARKDDDTEDTEKAAEDGEEDKEEEMETGN